MNIHNDTIFSISAYVCYSKVEKQHALTLVAYKQFLDIQKTKNTNIFSYFSIIFHDILNFFIIHQQPKII